jgi:iron complex outermembrane recepter protein
MEGLHLADSSRRDRLLSQTLLLGAALTSGFAALTPALAQADDDEIVVTGSRIPQPNLSTTSPVTQITAEDLTTQGVTRVEDLVNQLPQAFAAQNSTVSNGSTGTATVDLRGLGSERTLVLIDGRRMPYGSPFEASADLNQIPGQLIERVEVLTGGASAVYGSDALAGVVNFVMLSDFEGVRVDAQYGFYQHNNDYDTNGNLRSVIASRGLTNPTQFRIPDDNVIHGYSKEITGIMGVSTDDGRGNVTAYFAYRNNDAILQANYDYSACSIGAASATGFTCGGSGTTGPGGQFTDFGLNSNASNGPDGIAGTADDVPDTNPLPSFGLTVNGAGTFRNYNSGLDAFNFGPYNYFQRPDERYSLGAFGRYELNEHAEIYTQLMFTDYRTVAQIAPSGNFFSTGTINCDNPLLSAAQATAFGCGAPAAAAFAGGFIADPNVVPVYIGRRNIEGGGRQDDLQYQSYRAVVGVGGTLIDNWTYDVAAQFSRVTLSRVYLNDFSTTRLGRSLDVVTNPATGQPVCRSVLDGTDSNCVPYNIFSLGGVTPQALAYLQTPGTQRATTQQQVVTATIAGDTGINLFGTGTIATAFGIEYRRDSLDSVTDTAFATGDLAGQGGPTIGLNGVTDVLDLFVEAQIPLFHTAQLDLAYRYSEYNTGITTDTYKVAGDWSPIPDVRLRASFQRAVRAPNVIDLFAAQGFGLFDRDNDPCGAGGIAGLTGAALATRQTRCLATGVPSAQFGSSALDSPAGQYNQLTGGNPNLNAEEGETQTIGLVFTPRFAEGLVLSVDYFNIEVEGLISTTGSLNILSACYDQGNAAACARILRNPAGSLWIGTGRVENLNTNIGSLSTSGVDLVGDYGFELGFIPGQMGINFVGTYLESLETVTGIQGQAPRECVGFYGNQCGTPNPEWRHRARLSWDTPWNVSLAATWRHYGEVQLFGTTATRVDRYFEAENYFDLSGNWDVAQNANLRFGVNNVLDDDPQLSASVGTTGNGNTYPQTYEALGRFFFVGLTVDF